MRLPKHPGICVAPEYVIDDLLRAEGFTDIRRVPLPPRSTLPASIASRDEGGVHVGCFELFVREGIRGFADLVGKKIGIEGMGSPEHLFLSVITANVGIDPKAQIKWVTADHSGNAAAVSATPIERTSEASRFFQEPTLRVERPVEDFDLCAGADRRSHRHAAARREPAVP